MNGEDDDTHPLSAASYSRLRDRVAAPETSPRNTGLQPNRSAVMSQRQPSSMSLLEQALLGAVALEIGRAHV